MGLLKVSSSQASLYFLPVLNENSTSLSSADSISKDVITRRADLITLNSALISRATEPESIDKKKKRLNGSFFFTV